MKNDINQPKDYLDALNQAKLIITQSQEQFLRTANRISMEGSCAITTKSVNSELSRLPKMIVLKQNTFNHLVLIKY